MIVGITGGIGSGKTIISKLFETLGCKIYHSDDVAKTIYYKSDVKKKVIKLLGSNAYLSSTEINKAYISEKVFNDKALLEQLNQIIHPEVKSDFDLFCKRNNQHIILKEAAILFETGLHKDLDATILVCAPTDVKIDRVLKRSNLSAEEIRKRMSNQWNDDEKKKLATYIIHNDEHHAVIPQCIDIYDSLLKKQTVNY